MTLSRIRRRSYLERFPLPRNYTNKTLKQLFTLSGHYCAYPECPTRIVETSPNAEPVVLGEIAHIEASSNTGPRANPKLSALDRDSYANLIILCPTHHSMVDKNHEEYPSEMLHSWKKNAEQATASRLSVGATKVTFAELKMVCNAFLSNDVPLESTPMKVATPREKMEANGLTGVITPSMNVGLALTPTVAEFIRSQAKLVHSFPELLRSGFVGEFNRLKSEDLTPDEIFLYLIDFGANSASTTEMNQNELFVVRAAATAVLCHLFQVCDLFEPPK